MSEKLEVNSFDGKDTSIDSSQKSSTETDKDSSQHKDESIKEVANIICTSDLNNEDKIQKEINVYLQRYPYCIVWTPIPLITYLIPCIGHTGICTSEGIIHDFAGSYFVSVDNMGFGNPTKYVQLYPDINERDNWDKAVKKGDERYNEEEHNLCCNNCHSHVAYVLNVDNYKGYNSYTMFHIWWMVSIKSKYVSWGAVFKTYIGFFIVVAIIIGIYFLAKNA